MKAPDALLTRLAGIPGLEAGRRRLVVLLSQLGDFDSLEYAQALAQAQTRLDACGITVVAIGIGDGNGADRFCQYTGLRRSQLQVEPNADLHRALHLYAGLESGLGPWPDLLLMCAGIGSPGTLAEVMRGYSGDRTAPERIGADQKVQVGALPPLPGALFSRLGAGYQRPFELATVRLQNMVEVLSRWRTYVPSDAYITQRGGTWLLDGEDNVLLSHRDRGILGFSPTMARPLAFLDPYLTEAAEEQSGSGG
jgi:hypothetical protein